MCVLYTSFSFAGSQTPGRSAADPAEERLFSAAKRAFDDGAYNWAIGQFTRLIETYPDTSFKEEAQYLTALGFYNAGEKDQSMKRFEDLLADNSSGTRAVYAKYYICLILFEQNRYSAVLDEALTSLERFSKNEYSQRIRIIMARTFAALGRVEEALLELKKVKGGFQSEAAFERALIHYNTGNYPAAEDLFRSVINSSAEKNIKESSVFFSAKSIFFQKDFRRAETALRAYLIHHQGGSYTDEATFLLEYMPYEAGKHAESAEKLERYVKQNPNSDYIVQAIYFLGRSYEQILQPVLAARWYLEILSKGTDSPYYADSLIRLADIYRNRGDAARRLEMLEKLADQPSEAHREIANKELALFFAESDIDKSEKYFNTLIELVSKQKNKTAEYYHWYSRLLSSLGLTEKAGGLLEKAYAAETDPDKKEAVSLLLADICLQEGRYGCARERYENYLQGKEPLEKKEFVREALAYINYAEKNYPDALAGYASLTSSPDSAVRASAFFFVGEINRLLGKNNLAIRNFNTFLVNFPTDAKAYTARTKLAAVYYTEKRFHEAEKEYDHIIANETELLHRLDALYWKGWCRYQQKDLEGASIQFISVYELDSENKGGKGLESLLLAGKLYYNLEKYREARELYITLINNTPETNAAHLAEAYYEIAVSFLRGKDSVQAEFYFRKLAELFPQNEDIVRDGFLMLAEYYMQEQNFNNALGVYTALAETSKAGKTGTHGEYLFWKGYCHAQIGNSELAAGQYRACLQSGKNNYYYDAMNGLAEILINSPDQKQKDEAITLYTQLSEQNEREDLKKFAQYTLREGKKSAEKEKVMKASTENELKARVSEVTDREAKVLAWFRLGEAALKKGDRNEALKYFRLVTDNSLGEIAGNAQLQIVTILFETGDYLNAYNEGMTYYYHYQNYDIRNEKALYMIGLAAFRSGNTSDAKRFIDQLKKINSRSEYLKKLPNL